MDFYANVGRKRVSRIFLGTAGSPYAAGEDRGRLLDEMFSAGITAFDTARQYGRSEECLGKWISSRKNRERVYILTKCVHPGEDGTKRVCEKEIRKDVESSLSALRTDYIDALLLHRDDTAVPAGEVAEICNALIREGKILAYGGSNWTHARIRAANEYAAAHGLVPMTLSSPHFSLAEQLTDIWGGGCVTVTGSANADARAWYLKTQMPLVAYSSLCRGLFSGRVKDAESARRELDAYTLRGYVNADNLERVRRAEKLARAKGVTAAQIALAWMFHSGLNAFAVVGTSNAARMRVNIAAYSVSLTEKECAWLNLEGEQKHE